MKKIILIGCSGSMGKMIQENIKPPYKIVSCIDEKNQNIDDDYYAVLDFSTPKATKKFAPIFISKKIPYICGTTGFSEEDKAFFKGLCDIFHSSFKLVSNFDNTFKDFIESINLIKSSFKRAIIEEWHYKLKKDLPSGTAITIKNNLKELDVKIISHRVDKVRFIHQVTFYSDSKILTLKHIILNRKAYLKGIIKCLDNLSTNGFKEGL